jgi:hypothetical protein
MTQPLMRRAGGQMKAQAVAELQILVQDSIQIQIQIPIQVQIQVTVQEAGENPEGKLLL